MATLQPNVWWLEMMARECYNDGDEHRLVQRGNRRFAVHVVEMGDADA